MSSNRHDPEGWAESELSEDIPQEARWLVIRQFWRDCINGWTPETISQIPAAQRAVASGADPTDLVQAMRAAAYEVVFSVLSTIDDGHDPEAPADAPGWVLTEVRFVDPTGAGVNWTEQPTGRIVSGLHEDILGADPSGREGADLWD